MAEVTRVVAPNPGPYTGPGTNTWILGAGPATRGRGLAAAKGSYRVGLSGVASLRAH